jgi:uncharacterized protein YxeA
MELCMKKLLAVILVMILSSLFIFAQDKTDSKGLRNKSRSMAGYLVDQNCGKRMVSDDVKKSDAKAARHTKDCALDETCSAAGYGLVTGGKFYKFDSLGNRKAREYLKATTKENNIKVEIIGTMNGEKLAVESIKDFKSTGKNHGIKANVQ